MLVREIIDEVKEGIGKCSDAFAIKTITRAVQLLANKGLIDPLVGYFDFSVSNDFFVALPREVKTPLRVNINKEPTFSRSRIYEFHINSMGTQIGEEPGLSWSDRGYSPIQNEKALPGTLAYQVTNDADIGKTIIVTGKDENGRTVIESLSGTREGTNAGEKIFHRIEVVQRLETIGETFLLCNGTNLAAQYYGDELTPEYRVIKLSKSASNVRVMFRRHVFTLKTLDDFIPMHSELAVIQACKAVRFMGTDENDKAAASLTMAEMFLKEEQASREEHNTIAENQETQPAIDASTYVRDSIIVADVYDVAAEIFGPIGKRKLFDKITSAIEILSNRGQWDARLGWVDVFSADNRGEVTYDTPLAQNGKGHGYYVLPRHVEIPVAITDRCGASIPRNRWFEFHMNGDGGMRDRSSCHTWDDQGETCIIRKWPLNPLEEPKKRRPLPLQFVAVPDDPVDENVPVMLYGTERDLNDRDVEVWRGGKRGWACPCIPGNYNPGIHAPLFTSIERITKGESRGFIRLFTTTGTPEVPEVPTANVQTVITQWTFMGTPIDYTNGADRIVEIEPTWPLDPMIPRDVTFVFSNTSGPGTVHLYASVGDAGDVYVHNQVLALNAPTLVAWGDYSFQVTVIFGDETVRNIAEIPGTIGVPALWVTDDLFGMWYPDELEPKYRAIKLPHAAPKRIRVAYRKRTPKVTSLTEPIPLRSRFAIEQQLRAIKSAGEPQLAAQFEATALNYLRDERINIGPSVTGMFQFDESTAPGFTGNVQ